MLRELEPPRYDPAGQGRAPFFPSVLSFFPFFLSGITVSHLFDARLQPPCSRPG